MPLRWKDLRHLVWVRKKQSLSSEVFQVFVTDTRTVVWECASSSLEMNNWGFQQVLLLQHQESKSDSPLFLLLWPHSTQGSSPFVLKHLCQRIFSHMKPSGLHWAPGLQAHPRSFEGGSGILLPASGDCHPLSFRNWVFSSLLGSP